MKGLELAREYYLQYGKAMIDDKFPEYREWIAAGLVGQGSECFGFDDELSRDHDFGACFCMWLTDEDYTRIGADLQDAYDRLPGDFLGYPARRESRMSKGRTGVLRISDFYTQQIGRPNADLSPREWLSIPEYRLATVTNGEVFEDASGNFSAIRRKLLEFYPEDVRIKKLAASLVSMAQSGQYNFARNLCRGEIVAASLSLAEFMKSCMAAVFLLNRRYMPFYKWSHRGMHHLPVVSGAAELLDELARTPIRMENWISDDKTCRFQKVNKGDRQVMLVEKLCEMVRGQLVTEGLSVLGTDFLEPHAHEIMKHIKDNKIAAMHVMEG